MTLTCPRAPQQQACRTPCSMPPEARWRCLPCRHDLWGLTCLPEHPNHFQKFLFLLEPYLPHKMLLSLNLCASQGPRRLLMNVMAPECHPHTLVLRTDTSSVQIPVPDRHILSGNDFPSEALPFLVLIDRHSFLPRPQ